MQKSYQSNAPQPDKINEQTAKRKEGRTANKVLPKAGRNDFDSTFVQDSTAVILLNFCAKIPAFGNTRNVTCNTIQDT